MPERAMLLISCSQKEARAIRRHAVEQRRSISGYVLNICMRIVAIEEKILLKTGRSRPPFPFPGRPRPEAPRTTMLIRCSQQESRRIRAAAQMEDRTISGFVLRCLRLSWKASEAISVHGYVSEPSKDRQDSASQQ
jgi:hypothetical protein